MRSGSGFLGVGELTLAKNKWWSYNAGERGRNWVRAFEKPNGDLSLEWYDENRKRRRRELKGIRDKEAAKQKADELAALFARPEANALAPITVARLMDLYNKEVAPGRGKSKRDHDDRAMRVWKSFFDAQPESNRRSTRRPSTLDRTDWDRFVQWRRAGLIPGWERPVRDRQVQYDLKYLIAVLNWATGHRISGHPILELSPWRQELRRSQRWRMPKEKNPHRPGMPDDIRQGLMERVSNWQFGLALILERETRSRNSSIRQLVWADIDLEAGTVRWRGEIDKSGRERVIPLTATAKEALRRAPSRGIGDTPVFPAGSDPSKPTPRDTFQTWLRRAKASWLESVPESEREALKSRLRGIGFHAEKRAGVRDPAFRQLSPAIQEALAGTDFLTLKDVYDEVGLDDMREALEALERATSGVN